MYVEPMTTVCLLQDVPLDNTYTNTLWFDSLSEQKAYFSARPRRVFTEQSYQKVNKGTLRLEISANDAYKYNYMYFQNQRIGESTKWYFAFITSVEYVSETVTEIRYELDVLQTWLFDVELLPSLIDREHTATDEIGENVLPEPVDIGDLKPSVALDTGFFDHYYAVLARAQGGSN